MKKYFYILFFNFYSILCYSQSGIKVSLVNIPKIIEPGSYFNLIFDVESASTFTEPMTVSLKIPDTWEILSQKEPDIIIGEKKIKYIISVNTSKFTPPGTITSRIFINTTSGYRIEKPFQIKVLTVRNIIISPIYLPESAKEGDSLKVEYLVENRGNVKDNLKIEALRGKIDGKTEINGLNPDESTKFLANFFIPEGETNSYNFGFGIRATLKDSLKPVNYTNSILVYSKKIKKTELYKRFPIMIGFWANLYFLNKKTYYSFNADITGNGFLDKNNTHFLDFTIFGPSNFTNQFVGNYERYNLRYKYSKSNFMSTVQIGDYALQINRLMENNRFGRGVNFETRYKKFGIYGFYIKPRFFIDQKQTFGGKIYYLPNPKLQLSIDYSSKYFRIQRFTWVNLVGLSTKYKTEKFNFETEVTGSMFKNKYDFAVNTLFDINLNQKYTFGGNYLYAGKQFYGFYNNSYLLTNNVSVFLTKRINIGANVNISRVNSNSDLNNFYIAPFYSSYSGSVNYIINQNSSVNLNYTFFNNEDRMEVKRFFYKQQFGRLGYFLNGKKIIINYEARLGKAKNLLALDDPSIFKQSIYNQIRPEVRILPWAWAGLYAQHERTSRFSVQNKLINYFYYGASLRLPINKKISAEMMYRSNYAFDQINELQRLLYASIRLNLKKHTFELTGGKSIIPYRNSSFINDVNLLLKYTYLLNAPTSRLKNLGNIQGQIANSSDGIKNEGIVITLGDRKFRSDKDGKFYFKYLVPDKYYLDIDISSIPKGVITNLKLPLEVDLKADSTIQINLSLTKTGTIVGKVLFSNIENDEGKEKPSVLITLSNDTEKLNTRINKNDEFTCKQVKPGKWLITASIIGGNPEDYTITDAAQSIEVEADGLLEVEYTIERYKPTIEFTPSTFNLVEENEDKVSSVIKENIVTKENSATNEKSVTKENSISKENSAAKENSATKENNAIKENNVNKENSVSKENSVTKENNISKEDNVSKENEDTWSNKTTPVNKTKPKTIPKTKSILKDVNQTKNTIKNIQNNKTKKQIPKKKPNYTVISI